MSYGGVDAQRDRIGQSQFDLAGTTRWAQHANVWQHAATRSNDHDRLLGRVKTVLVKIFFRFQDAAGTKQDFDVLVGQVNMSR